MHFLRTSWFLAPIFALTWSANAHAVASAEIYTSQSYQYGRFSARIQYAPGSGVVSSFFLWKDGSELEGVFWNELDFEKLEGECRLETNAIWDDPVELAPEREELSTDLCSTFHTYTYEWTPEYIAWFVDDVEIRRETEEIATAFAEHATDGMQFRFNVWPGDETFGGAFDPIILPVYQYIDWVEYSSYADGQFTAEWREDFSDNMLPSGWLRGSWESPKQLSTHTATNVGFINGFAVLALTPDDATGIEGADPGPGDTTAAPSTSAPAETTAPPATTDGITTTPNTGGATTNEPVPNPTMGDAADNADGCSCRLAGNSPTGKTPFLALLGIGVALVSRRLPRKPR